MVYYFKDYVDVEKIKSNPSLKILEEQVLKGKPIWRYSLEIPFIERKVDGKIAYIIMKNPSEAGLKGEKGYISDYTVNRICKYFNKNKYSKVVILNLASKYGTDLREEEYDSFNDLISPTGEIEGNANDNEIEKQLAKFREGIDTIVVGWGGSDAIVLEEDKKLYNIRITNIEKKIKIHSKDIYQYPSNLDYPVHPAKPGYWYENVDLVPYP